MPKIKPKDWVAATELEADIEMFESIKNSEYKSKMVVKISMIADAWSKTISKNKAKKNIEEKEKMMNNKQKREREKK